MRTYPVTPRQREVLDAIDIMTELRGPTVRALGDRLGILSSATTQAHINALVRKGLLVRLGGSRGTVLTEVGRLLTLVAKANTP